MPRKLKVPTLSFPQTIVVKQEPADDELILIAANATNLEELAELGADVTVGVYRLDTVQTLKTKVGLE